MNQSDFRITNQTPPTKFFKLNHSQQLIPEECLPPTVVSVNPSPRQKNYKKVVKKTLKMKDNERKKIVWCDILNNDMNPMQLAMSKKGKYCRICMQEEETSRFLYPCKCSGSLKFVHEECFKSWILMKSGVEKVFKNDIQCEVCKQKILMKTNFLELVKCSILNEIPKHQKVCWFIIIFIILLLLAGVVILSVQVGVKNVGIAAAITLLIVVSLVLIVYLIAKILHNLTIEIIDQWTIQNYHPENSDDKIGTIISIPAQSILNTSPRSQRQRRKSIAPQFGGLQIVQFDQYPSDI